MDYKIWEPIYKQIVNDFGYSQEEDRRAAEILSKVRGSDGLKPLKRLEGKVIEVKGPFFDRVYNESSALSIIAGSSISRLSQIEGRPDLIVTDLDGDTALQLEKNLEGTPVVIHAHGDNIDLIEEWAPKFQGHVISTCQCNPPNDVYNFGGFTDGDRAVVMADHFDAERVVLDGWDFDRVVYDDRGQELKERKMEWAKRIIERLDVPVEGI